MRYKYDLTGMRFGRLEVISLEDVPKEKRLKMRGTYWRCKCDCGTTKVIQGSRLRSGAIKSCGCYHRELIKSGFSKTHGLSNTRIYKIHKDINRRCFDKKNKSYSDYGGRGISVCKEWKGVSNVVNFYQWAITHGYSDDLTIDRIDLNGDYSPDNCRWVNGFQQANNKRNNVNITINGVTKTKAEWSRIYGINYHTICSRLNKGIDPVSAVITPVKTSSRKNALDA